MEKTGNEKEPTRNETDGESRRGFLKTNLGRALAAAGVLTLTRDGFAGHHRNITGHANAAQHTNNWFPIVGHTNSAANHTNTGAQHDNYLQHANCIVGHTNAGQHANTMIHVNEILPGCPNHSNMPTHANKVQGHNNFPEHKNF